MKKKMLVLVTFAILFCQIPFAQTIKESIYLNLGMGRTIIANNDLKSENSSFNPYFIWEAGVQRRVNNKFNLSLGINYSTHWIYTRNSLEDSDTGIQIGIQPDEFLNTYFRLHNLGISIFPSLVLKETENTKFSVALGYQIGSYLNMNVHYSIADDIKGYSLPLMPNSFLNHSIFLELFSWNRNKNSEILFMNVFRIRASYNLSGLAGNGKLGYFSTGVMFGL